MGGGSPLSLTIEKEEVDKERHNYSSSKQTSDPVRCKKFQHINKK